VKSVDTVLTEATSTYQKRWRSWLVDGEPTEIAFSLGAPGAVQIAKDASGVTAWSESWHGWAALRPGVTIVPKEVPVPSWGVQTIPGTVVFGGVDEVADTDPSLAAHWALAISRWALLTERGVSAAAVRPALAALLRLSEADFGILVAAADYFRREPRSGLLPRQVPVEGMHTKWLARHRRLVSAVLGHAADPADLDASGDIVEDVGREDLDQDELDELGLRSLPRLVDVILADPTDRIRLAGLHHLRAPEQEIAALPLAPRTVLIVENKESAQIVRDRPGLVVIHSLGNNLAPLALLPWLAGADVVYWGDLDRAGFTLLSRARTLVPGLRSALMDHETLSTHRRLANRENVKNDAPDPTLTAEEQHTLRLLSSDSTGAGFVQLEQERLAGAYVCRALDEALDARP
jgi:hypothetical protein